MCFICKRESVFVIYGKCADSLAKKQAEDSSLANLKSIDYIYNKIGYKEYTQSQSDYLYAKWCLSLVTRFRYKTNCFHIGKDTVCDAHIELTDKLIKFDVIIPKVGEDIKLRYTDFLYTGEV